jgi:DNA polymerase-3 subunit delta
VKRNLTGVIADIKNGKGPALLLVFGDDLLIQQTCATLVDALVPPAHKSFNFERFDGRTVSRDLLEASLLTPPFFPGKKVLWIENAPYFCPREQKGELGERTLQLWSEGRKDEARELLLEMLAVEGWTQEQWDELDSVSSARLSSLFEIDRPAARSQADALLAYCKSQGIDLTARKTAGDQCVEEWLEQGLPEWDFVLLSSVDVDRRTRLYKRLEDIGAALHVDIEREKNGKLSRQRLLEFITERVHAAGKELDPHARELILLRAGDDLREIAQELEKLLLYVVDQTSVRAGDVAAIFIDQASAWIFDLTQAIADRDAVAALAHLGRLMGQGEHPLKLLGTIAAELRRLLSARQLLENELRGCWRRGMSYAQFQESILKQSAPLLMRNPYAEYMLFQRADKLSISSLRRQVGAICATDFRLKSSGGNPRLVMEKLILNLCLQS